MFHISKASKEIEEAEIIGLEAAISGTSFIILQK
jgi:hypothetical protein